MALVNAGRLLYPEPNRFIAAGSLGGSSNFQINGSGHRWAWVFPVPRSGTIDQVGIRIGTLTTAVTTRLGLYTVDGSGNPTSTGYGGSTYGTFTPAANTYFSVSLGSSATATQGDTAALVMEFDSTTGDFFTSTSSQTVWSYGFPYANKFNGTTWSHVASSPPICGHVRYTTSPTYPSIGTMPFTGAIAGTAYNLNTAGADEYAVRIPIPFKCRVAGIWTLTASNAGADYEAILYSGTTALATATRDGDFDAQVGGANIPRFCVFSSGVTLNAGDVVRAAIRPTTTNNVAHRSVTLIAAGAEEALSLPSGTYQSTRVDQGSWTDATTTLPCIGLLIDQLDDGVSAGGLLRHPGMAGGFGA